MKVSNLNPPMHFALFAFSAFLMLIFFSCEEQDYDSLDEQEITSDISFKKSKPINYKVSLNSIDPDIIVTPECLGDNKQASGWVNFRDCVGVDSDDGEIRGAAGFVLITDNTGRIVEVTFGIKNKGKKEPQYSTGAIPATQIDEDGDIKVKIEGIDIPLRRHKNGTGNGGPIVNDNVAELTFGELFLDKQ